MEETGPIQDEYRENPEERLIEERKAKIKNFLKNSNWIPYVFLTVITFLAIRIRTRNLPGLRDITTGTWTLGPDLDPFLFLRWSKYIIENGKLFAIDTMRYSPLGYNTKGELLFHPYMMAWFHKLASIFGSTSPTHSAVLYPVFMWALTVIAFFLLARKIFLDSMGDKNANVIALISAFFISVLPVILPRTIAGIPEKESAAFLFLFLSLYLFLSAWKAKPFKSQILLSIFAGAATAGMALIWGGYGFIFLTINLAVIAAFLLGKIDRRKFYVFVLWMLSAFALMIPFSTRYTVKGMLSNLTITGASIFIAFVFLAYFIIQKGKFKRYIEESFMRNLPKQITALIISAVIGGIATSFLLGIGAIISAFSYILRNLITPVESRLILTVAENRQPFYKEWVGNFGPILRGIPVFFWLFFLGSIHLFKKMLKSFRKKEAFLLTASYAVFLFAIIFSRYATNSTLNGTSGASLLLYLIGFSALIGAFGYYYYKFHKSGEESKLKSIDFGHLILLSFFFLGIIAARGAVRLIMMLAPPTSIIAGYFIVAAFSDAKKSKDDFRKIISWTLAIVIILASVFAGYQFYKISSATAQGYVPSAYTQQWQKTMSWVRENTPQDSVFGHWWDYGYWLQSIGERATVLDGGNSISYWNYFMGRYALTGTSDIEALEFLYAHNTTHFLIDSTDIGKYSAFSSIGSDLTYDRRSWIPAFLRDDNQMQERKNSTLYLFKGGTVLDEDIIYDNNGTRIFLPGGKAAIGGVLVDVTNSNSIISPPEGLFIYQGQQYRLPLRYIYSNGKFVDFGEGVESGIFLMPRVNDNGQVFSNGALLYLSKRTVKSQLARHYLYNEENPYFKLVHTEDDVIVAQLKEQNAIKKESDIIYYRGIRGPIRIWEINYPENIKLNKDFLETAYPDELRLR